MNNQLTLAEHTRFVAERTVEENQLFDEVLIEPFGIRGGGLYPPTAAEFGVELREETVRNHTYTYQEWRGSNQPEQTKREAK